MSHIEGKCPITSKNTTPTTLFLFNVAQILSAIIIAEDGEKFNLRFLIYHQ